MEASFRKGTIQTEHGLEWAKPDSRGYGKCYFGVQGFEIQARAHRIAWILVNGPIPEGFDIDHDPTCPKTCVTVDHLQMLSHSDHVKLGWERGELNGGWGTKRERIHAKRPAPFSWQTIRECKNCGSEFTPKLSQQVHCSTKCTSEYKENRRRRVRYPRPEIINCEWCDEVFAPKRIDTKLCSRKCIDDSQNEKKKQVKLANE